jgi:hypothetical protein
MSARLRAAADRPVPVIAMKSSSSLVVIGCAV